MIRRILASLPWTFRAAGATALYLAVHDGLPAWTALGCVIGFLIGQEPLGDLWFLLVHRLFGGRAYAVSYGRGRKIWSGTIAGVPVELGLRPASGLVIPWGQQSVPAVRLRVWATSTAMFALHGGLGTWLATSCTGLPQGIGYGLLFTLVTTAVLTASRPIDSLWAVFVLPFRANGVKVDLPSPSAVEAERLLIRGLIPEARRKLDEGEPALLTAAAITLAEGRCEQAQELVLEDLDRGCQERTACWLIGMVLISHADAGELPPELAGARLEPFLNRWNISDPALVPDFLPTADLARFRNDNRTAVRVARRLSRQVSSSFWRAEACCSLAAALIADGRPEKARKALARARRECPELARIADVERMLPAA
ncbi:hypothetical protein ACIBCA_05800 [Kitasatospora sp. NPDC051170]|uniref:hypothetical protein n=1 Tax=Kitasatospora sp. NPDC051170 TaxID=3364056 RepID=UPI0037876B21